MDYLILILLALIALETSVKVHRYNERERRSAVVKYELVFHRPCRRSGEGLAVSSETSVGPSGQDRGAAEQMSIPSSCLDGCTQRETPGGRPQIHRTTGENR